MLVFVGCYTRAADHIRGDLLGDGITTLKVQEDGRISRVAAVKALNPSFLCCAENRDGSTVLYCVHEVSSCRRQGASACVTSGVLWVGTVSWLLHACALQLVEPTKRLGVQPVLAASSCVALPFFDSVMHGRSPTSRTASREARAAAGGLVHSGSILQGSWR
jgi:hypothetical protein